MTRRDPSLPLPQYGKKESDYVSKKAWQSARARESGYKSYADWLKARRKAEVKRTNLGRASESYKAKKIKTGCPSYSQKIEYRLRNGNVFGMTYYFNIKKNGWSGFNQFIATLHSQSNIQVKVKDSSGQVYSYSERAAASMIQTIQESKNGKGLVESLTSMIDEYTSQKGEEEEKKKVRIVMVYVIVYGPSTVKKY